MSDFGPDPEPNQVGWDCEPLVADLYYGTQLYADGETREELEEGDVDLVTSQQEELFGLDRKSVVLKVKGCEVQVFPDGNMQWWDDPAGSDWASSDYADNECLAFYQGEPA